MTMLHIRCCDREGYMGSLLKGLGFAQGVVTAADGGLRISLLAALGGVRMHEF